MKRLFFDDLGLTMLGFIVGSVLLLAVAVAAVASISYKIESRNCAYASRQFDRPTRYDLFAGCYVRTDNGTYVPVDSYRAVVK